MLTYKIYRLKNNVDKNWIGLNEISKFMAFLKNNQVIKTEP